MKNGCKVAEIAESETYSYMLLELSII